MLGLLTGRMAATTKVVSGAGISALHFARQYQSSLLLALLVVATAAVTDSLAPSARLALKNDLGFDRTAFLTGRWWVVVLSPFVQANPGMTLSFWTMTLFLLVGGAFMERVLGHVAVIFFFFATHILSTFLTLGVLALAALAGYREASRLLMAKDTGVSAALVGVLGADFALIRDRRAAWLWAGMVVWMLFGIVRFQLDTEIAHGLGVVAGAALVFVVPAYRRRRVG